MSDSTENFDRDKKFLAYLQAESLKEYALIAQHTPRVVSYFRQPDGTWSFAFAQGKDSTARLRSPQIDLPLSEVYAKVELPVVDDDPDSV